MFIKALLSNFTCSLYSLISTVSSRLNFFSRAFLSSSVKELGSTGRRITPTGKWYRVKYDEPSGLMTRTLYCKGYFSFFGLYKLKIRQEKHELRSFYATRICFIRTNFSFTPTPQLSKIWEILIISNYYNNRPTPP